MRSFWTNNNKFNSLIVLFVNNAIRLLETNHNKCDTYVGIKANNILHRIFSNNLQTYYNIQVTY